DDRSGIDFLVVGDINQTQLNKFVDILENKEDKEIRYTVLTLDDFMYRQRIKDRFVANVLASKAQVLVDKQGFFEENKE
ncbi:hypothetical protein KDA11_01715, partial [Candidatus Saccharibacteria bacterium]|nr:hypothetical protein [Candidatus Saccharibacteria bacterium]